MARPATARQRGHFQDKRGRSRERRCGFFLGQLATLKAGTRTVYEAGWRRRQASARAAGERDKYVGPGRFGDKKGRQISSAFEVSTHNERIKGIYGNYNFWSWLRYWYLDSANLVQLYLIDKGYYDYDFEVVPKIALVSKTKKSKAEINQILRNFGLPIEEETEDDKLQDFIIKEEQKNGS